MYTHTYYIKSIKMIHFHSEQITLQSKINIILLYVIWSYFVNNRK